MEGHSEDFVVFGRGVSLRTGCFAAPFLPLSQAFDDTFPRISRLSLSLSPLLYFGVENRPTPPPPRSLHDLPLDADTRLEVSAMTLEVQ